VSESLAFDLVRADEPEWVAFVGAHADALPYHHPAWAAAIASAYGYEANAAVMRASDGSLLGGFPVIEVGGRMRSRRWVSLPFSDYCPPLLSPRVDESALAGAMDRARERFGVASVELRAPVLGGTAAARGVTHELALGDPHELSRSFESQVRHNIKKAERSAITVRRGSERSDLVERYFGLHVDTRRRLGVPPQPRRFFAALWGEVFAGGLGHVLLVEHEGVAIAGAVFLEWNGRLVYKYGASDSGHWELRPNNLLFWHAIRDACERGLRCLDFGRTDVEDAGLRAFKRSWGAVEADLEYTSFGGVPEGGVGRMGDLARPIIRVAPRWVAQSVGSALYRFSA
jgi:CelD/BcsL family acetyltransferase involved in cellulose biosynthesis